MVKERAQLKNWDKVLHWDDERGGNEDNGIIVMLKRGWCWDMMGQGEHTLGFDTLREAKQALAKEISECHCSDCITGKGW